MTVDYFYGEFLKNNIILPQIFQVCRHPGEIKMNAIIILSSSMQNIHISQCLVSNGGGVRKMCPWRENECFKG